MHKITVLTVRDPEIARIQLTRLSTNITKSDVYRLESQASEKMAKGIDIVVTSDKFKTNEEFMTNLIQDLLALTR